jgi:predicted nucleic acid-binding protein
VIVVSDTSPLTALLTVGRAELLRDLFGEVVIPPAVRDELIRHHAALPDFLRVAAPHDRGEIERLGLSLGAGESEAIVLAKELHADYLLMDEYEGRRVAIRAGLRVTGVLGVLIRAKDKGLIASIGPLIDRMMAEAGIYVAPEIVADALRLAGEKV